MKKKVWGFLFLTLCIPSMWAAADESSSMIHFYQEVEWASPIAKERSESTLYFNDGFGRLTEFHMTQAQRIMTLTIRQNMNVVWQGRVEADNSHFSVSREEREGQVYFRITMGSREYKAFLNDKDRWDVVEIKNNMELGTGKEGLYPLS